MSWNYRVVRRVHKHATGEDIDYAIHEVFYTDGKPDVVTKNAIPARGESVEGVRWALERMLEALDKPVLEYSEIAKEE